MKARWYGAVLVGALVAAGCTDEASPTVSTVELTTTVVAQAPTTSAPATSTTAPESTAPPTSSQEEIEAELIATLDGGNEVFQLNPPDPESPLLERYYTVDEAKVLREAFERDLADGVHLEGQFVRLSLESIEVDGDSAVVVECGIDAFQAVGPEGDVLTEADDFGLIRIYNLERGSDGLWRIGRTTFGPEKLTCEG